MNELMVRIRADDFLGYTILLVMIGGGGGGRQVHWHREKTWIDNYLSLEENDPIVQVFIELTENL